jgi:hypothetical protein
MNPYELLGTILIFMGGVEMLFYFAFGLAGLIANGLSTTVLGIVSLLIGNNKRHISNGFGMILLKTEVKNTTAMLTALAITFSIINVLLVFLDCQDVGFYATADAIGFSIITMFYFNIDAICTSSLNKVRAVLFTEFSVIVCLKVIDLIW